MRVRAEKAALQPAKDRQRAAVIEPYERVLAEWARSPAADAATLRARHEFHWMVEEFRVSVHAQELGTAFPVSAKRLDKFLESAGVNSGGR